MEVVRSAWRKPLLVYKFGLWASFRNRNNSSSASKVAREVDVSIKDDDLKISKIDIDYSTQNDATFNALVSTEELLAQIGLAREFAIDNKVAHPYVDKLKRIQMILFDLSYTILIPGKDKPFDSKHITDLEEWIIEYTKQLPPQESYIIPGGGKACSTLHSAKAMCKRVERNVGSLVQDGLIDKQAHVYLKKLQNFLLTTSRIAAKCEQRREYVYIPKDVKNNETN